MSRFKLEVLQGSSQFEEVSGAVKNALLDSPYAELKIDNSLLQETLVTFLPEHNPDGSRILAYVKDEGKVVGLVAAVVSKGHFIFNKEQSLGQEVVWWVHEDYRGSKIGKLLLTVLETWAKELGLSRLALGHYENDTGRKVGILYRRLGYKPVEHNYIKEL